MAMMRRTCAQSTAIPEAFSNFLWPLLSEARSSSRSAARWLHRTSLCRVQRDSPLSITSPSHLKFLFPAARAENSCSEAGLSFTVRSLSAPCRMRRMRPFCQQIQLRRVIEINLAALFAGCLQRRDRGLGLGRSKQKLDLFAAGVVCVQTLPRRQGSQRKKSTHAPKSSYGYVISRERRIEKR